MPDQYVPDVTGGRGTTPLHRRYPTYESLPAKATPGPDPQYLMQPDTGQRIATALERIADALERPARLHALRDWPI